MSASPSSASRLGTTVAEKPNRKACCVNRPADAFGIYDSTPHRFSAAVATSQEERRLMDLTLQHSLHCVFSGDGASDFDFFSFGRFGSLALESEVAFGLPMTAGLVPLPVVPPGLVVMEVRATHGLRISALRNPDRGRNKGVTSSWSHCGARTECLNAGRPLGQPGCAPHQDIVIVTQVAGVVHVLRGCRRAPDRARTFRSLAARRRPEAASPERHPDGSSPE
jgi:hypothetical protein